MYTVQNFQKFYIVDDTKRFSWMAKLRVNENTIEWTVYKPTWKEVSENCGKSCSHWCQVSVVNSVNVTFLCLLASHKASTSSSPPDPNQYSWGENYAGSSGLMSVSPDVNPMQRARSGTVSPEASLVKQVYPLQGAVSHGSYTHDDSSRSFTSQGSLNLFTPDLRWP